MDISSIIFTIFATSVILYGVYRFKKAGSFSEQEKLVQEKK